MKTVSGQIISTKPVNLYKAANILSNFVNSDNGASQSVSAYLRRASAAFNELVYFKKHHNLKKNKKVNEDRNLEQDDVRVVENGGVNKKPDQDPVENEKKGTSKVEGELRNKEKKKDYVGVEIEQGNEMVKRKSEDKKKKKKKKKKRKNEEIDGGENGNLEAPERNKRRRIEADE